MIVGGGAIGVQMATDIKEMYPDKEVTLVHSRATLMPAFHPKMDEILRRRLGELGVEFVYTPKVSSLLTASLLTNRKG